METLWFALVALGIAIYVVLDGFDIGAGALHLIAGRNSSERAQILASIGPFWDGNEVWLLAGGGTLYFAFPVLYSAAFSGFYLPLMIVLWLLIGRGIAIEFRNHLESPIWTPFWDAIFSLSSTLLAVFFGAALGNVVRGVPLDANQEFFLPLWTNFQVYPAPGILDWYTILTGVTALAVLSLHGAIWIRYKTHDALETRATVIARRLWYAVAALTVVITGASFTVQPLLTASLAARPWMWIFPVLAIAGLVWAERNIKIGGRALAAFAGSSAYIAGMLLSVVGCLYPYVLPAVRIQGQPDLGLTVFNAAAPQYGLQVGLVWWIPGLVLACGYAIFLYRRFAGKVDKPAAT
jgi:cytochrome bd ubiquinol oxidase subunit II